jgi:hypothetical protein
MGKNHWVEKTISTLIQRRVANASQLYRLVGVPEKINNEEFLGKIATFVETGLFTSIKIAGCDYYLPSISAGMRLGLQIVYPDTKGKLIAQALYSEFSAQIISTLDGSWTEMPRKEWKMKIPRDVRGFILGDEKRLCMVDPNIEQARELLSLMPLTVISHYRQDGGLLQDYVGKKRLVVLNGKELLSA